jgi:hypothetical protein
MKMLGIPGVTERLLAFKDDSVCMEIVGYCSETFKCIYVIINVVLRGVTI